MRFKVLVIIGILSLIVLSGCSQSYLKEKTVDEIKKLKAEGKPVSEFDKCQMEVEKGDKLYENYSKANENYIHECIKAKLLEKGYKDDLNCIENYDNPICQDRKRYNADVFAQNECMNMNLEEPPEVKNRITLIDCMALIS